MPPDRQRRGIRRAAQREHGPAGFEGASVGRFGGFPDAALGAQERHVVDLARGEEHAIEPGALRVPGSEARNRARHVVPRGQNRPVPVDAHPRDAPLGPREGLGLPPAQEIQSLRQKSALAHGDIFRTFDLQRRDAARPCFEHLPGKGVARRARGGGHGTRGALDEVSEQPDRHGGAQEAQRAVVEGQDPDHGPARVQERAAVRTRVEGRIGLEHEALVGRLAAGLAQNVAPAQHAGADAHPAFTPGHAVGVAEGQDDLPHALVFAEPEGQARQGAVIELREGTFLRGVHGQQRRGQHAPVAQRHADIGRARREHRARSQDHAVRPDDRARPEVPALRPSTHDAHGGALRPPGEQGEIFLGAGRCSKAGNEEKQAEHWSHGVIPRRWRLSIMTHAVPAANLAPRPAHAYNGDLLPEPTS